MRYWISQLIRGVAHIHSNKVIHRDLKLGNLFIDSDLVLKIGDFGLSARLSDAFEKRKSLCGTPNYLAPEMLEKLPYGGEIDAWAIGVITYSLLVGRAPFEGNHVSVTYANIKTGKFSFPDPTNLHPLA